MQTQTNKGGLIEELIEMVRERQGMVHTAKGRGRQRVTEFKSEKETANETIGSDSTGQYAD